MKKNIRVVVLLILLAAICFAGCDSKVAVMYDNPALIYNGDYYLDTDSEGRSLSSAWTIPDDIDSQEVDVFFGEKVDKEKTPNSKGTVFDREDLDGWLCFDEYDMDEPRLYRRENLELPDYRDNAVIETILIKTDLTKIVIDDPEEIQTLMADITKTAIKAENQNERSDDLSVFFSIELKYQGCGAWFNYGELEEDADGNWCLVAFDLNDDLIYQISDNSEAILKKHNVDFSIFEDAE